MYSQSCWRVSVECVVYAQGHITKLQYQDQTAQLSHYRRQGGGARGVGANCKRCWHNSVDGEVGA
jgi:hypothetical protein